MAATSLSDLDAALARADAAVFDLDGTLYDTRDFERPALEGVVRWLSERAGRPLPGAREQLWARRESDRHRPGLFDDVLREHGLPAEWGADCAHRFHAHPGAELENAPSLRPLLERLRERGCRLALVSNGRAELQQRKLARLGLGTLFDRCVFCDPAQPVQLKPSRWAWSELQAWRGASTPPFVGDDPVDEQFAAGGNVPFLAFSFRSEAYAD
jgi:FMN phosphatase YigB (HAD superfamily)